MNGVSVGAPHVAEAARGDDLAQLRLAGLRAERRADLLRQRGRHADHRRAGIVEPADRVQIVLQAVAGHRLDDHPGAVRLQRLADMRGRAGRIAHVVQAVEEGHQVEVRCRIILGRADLEAGVRRDAMRRWRARAPPRSSRMEVVADEVRLRERLGHQHGRPAVAAADIGHLGAALSFVDDAIERGQPRD